MTEPNPFMLRALELAQVNARAGGGPFGAVIVRDGAVIGEGANHVTSGNDPTAHAEIVAIRDACYRLATFQLDGAVIYCTCEPCPMCLGAILWARIAGLVYAGDRADAAAAGFDDAAFYREVCLPARARTLSSSRALAEQGRALLASWLTEPARRPY